uniref:MSP domain-containing protein n=1 Tax=Strigamia maritima TaxID=126957 RepID=T1JLC2_STRMM
MLDTSIDAHFKIYNDGKVDYCYETMFHKYESLLQISLAKTWSNVGDSYIAFNICGEGVLPMVNITKPVCQNDSYCLTFLQLLVGEVQELAFQLKNVSAVSSMITMELFDPDGSFWVVPLSPELKLAITDELIAVKNTNPSSTVLPDAEPALPEKGSTFTLQANETADFAVYFAPLANKMFSASIRFDVWGNFFDNPLLMLMGEGCDSDLVIKVQNDMYADETQDSNCWKQPKRFNFLDLGQCHVNQTYKNTITMINKSPTVARFELAQNDLINFSPQVAHVKEFSRKDVAVIFYCETPIAITQARIECKVEFWDDRKK